MQKLKEYVAYLQHLLKENQIPFKTQLQLPQQKQQAQSKGGPLQTNLVSPLQGDLLARYSRQMLLKDIQYEGQLRIINAKVAIIGCGGIGCPLGLYLAGAGVGTLGLFDSDNVDMTNLHRQIGHSTKTLNTPKTQSLKSTLLNLNPNIKINQHPFITVETLPQLDDYDLVIDGSDNPQCRYLVNDYLMSKSKKLLSGACIGWEAQITCYGGQKAPCYRCIWGNDQVSLGGCSTLGVIGMLPGYVGMILGVQALKVLLKGQSSLQGFLSTYEGRTCQMKKLKIRGKLPNCPACGENKLDIKTYDYSRYGTCAPVKSLSEEIPSQTWSQHIEKNKKETIVDVRAPSQFNIIHFLNSKNIPYEDLVKMDKETIQKQVPNPHQIGVSCKSGVMSKKATSYLREMGFEAYNIIGGINSYGKEYDSGIVNL